MDASRSPDSISHGNPHSNSHGNLNGIPHNVKRWIFRIAVVFFALIFLRILINWFNSFQKQTHPPVPVIVAKAKKSDVPVYLPALGSVVPMKTVLIKTQVNGQLQKVLFKEGQVINAGDIIAEIDPKPYQAQLAQFEGQLARDEALLANAKIDLARYELLFKQDSVSEQILETQRWQVKQLEGTVKFDIGQVNAIKVNLGYTQILSPITGRVGLRLVDPGNFVQTSDVTGLAVINTIQPITVIFSLPEDNLLSVLQKVYRGERLTVEVYDRTQNKLLDTGRLLSLDNQIDPTTGTFKIKSIFINEDNILFPNQFVNVKLEIDILKDIIVVPTQAIQHGVFGTFVYVVYQEGKLYKVSVKPVTVKTTLANNTAIVGDVALDQEVVIQGADKLIEGSIVNIGKHE